MIEETFGEAINESANRYGLNWTSYHDDFRNFMMVMYDERDIAQGIYTNQDTILIDDTLGIGSSKQAFVIRWGRVKKVYNEDHDGIASIRMPTMICSCKTIN